MVLVPVTHSNLIYGLPRPPRPPGERVPLRARRAAPAARAVPHRPSDRPPLRPGNASGSVSLIMFCYITSNYVTSTVAATFLASEKQLPLRAIVIATFLRRGGRLDKGAVKRLAGGRARSIVSSSRLRWITLMPASERSRQAVPCTRRRSLRPWPATLTRFQREARSLPSRPAPPAPDPCRVKSRSNWPLLPLLAP